MILEAVQCQVGQRKQGRKVKAANKELQTKVWVQRCVKKKRKHLLRLHELGQSDAPSGDWLGRKKSPLWRVWDLPTVLAEDKNILRNNTCPLSSGHQATTVISKKLNFPRVSCWEEEEEKSKALAHTEEGTCFIKGAPPGWWRGRAKTIMGWRSRDCAFTKTAQWSIHLPSIQT